MSAAEAMFANELDNASVGYRVGGRRSLLEDALDRTEALEFHSLQSSPDEE
jgi:hypothetical protein